MGTADGRVRVSMCVPVFVSMRMCVRMRFVAVPVVVHMCVSLVAMAVPPGC